MFDKNLWQYGKRIPLLLPLTIIFSIISGLLILVQALILSGIITQVFLKNMTFNMVLPDLLWLLGIMLLRAVVSWLEENAALKLSHRVQADITQEILRKISKIGPIRMQSQQAGSLLSLLTEGIPTLDPYFRHYIPQLFRCALIPLLFLVTVFPIDWISGIIMLLTAPLVPMFMMLIGKWTQKVTRRQWDVLGRISNYLQDVLRGITTLKILGQHKAQAAKIRSTSYDFHMTSMKVLKVAFTSALTLELVTTLSIALVAVGLGVRLVGGGLDFRWALFLILIAPEYYQPLRSLGTQYHSSLNGVEVSKNLMAFLTLPEAQEQGGENPGTIKPPDITLENLSYTYNHTRQALANCNLMVKAGTTVALVGASGGGKSTLLNLVGGFLQPTSGRILIDNIDLATYGAIDWRQNLAIIPQHPHIFASSIRENILLGNTSSTDADLIDACKTLGIHDFIESLPEAYHTKVGEGGRGLSGGQKQLLAIARAYLANAPLVLCDEATQGLDLITEEMIVSALTVLFQGRTVIIAAHRLATISHAQQIVLLEQGEILEQGTPKELMANSTYFTRLLKGGEYHGK